MEKQYFAIELTESPEGAISSVHGEFTPQWLVKALGQTLKLHPQLIEIFLDATGECLIAEKSESINLKDEVNQVADNLKAMFGNPKG